MRLAGPRNLLPIIGVSLMLVGVPEVFAQQQDDPEEPIQTIPKDGNVSPPKVKTVPSIKATPIEIPGKGQPIVKKKPSVKATPIEIPGRR